MRENQTAPIHALMWNSQRSSLRHKVERWSTLRSGDGAPRDVTIDDLSLTGFRMSDVNDLTQQDLIMVGLAGVGVREAMVVWIRDDSAGCRFSDPITPLQFEQTISANTVVQADFGSLPIPSQKLGESEDSGKGMSGRRVLATIFAAALGAWGGVIALGYAIASLAGAM